MKTEEYCKMQIAKVKLQIETRRAAKGGFKMVAVRGACSFSILNFAICNLIFAIFYFPATLP